MSLLVYYSDDFPQAGALGIFGLIRQADPNQFQRICKEYRRNAYAEAVSEIPKIRRFESSPERDPARNSLPGVLSCLFGIMS